MSEQEQQQHDELPLERIGASLRRAREAAGLSRADIAARTKIAERHLAAIEADNFRDLASSTYAVGFSRAYARAVGLDEAEVARAVRADLGASDENDQRAKPNTFEPGDPARVPGLRVAWVAAVGAVVVIAAVFVFSRSYYSPAVSLPELTAPQAPASAAASAAPAAPPRSTVVFTALESGVWVKFYDAAGAQLMQKEMAKGESYVVPADASGPLIRTARPDALAITVGGRPVPPLAARQMTIADVPVSAAALLARPAPAVGTLRAAASAVGAPAAPAGAPSPHASASSAPAPRAAASSMPRPAGLPSRAAAPAPVPAPAPAAVPAGEGAAASTTSD